jgi:hypothetical protein
MILSLKKEYFWIGSFGDECTAKPQIPVRYFCKKDEDSQLASAFKKGVNYTIGLGF